MRAKKNAPTSMQVAPNSTVYIACTRKIRTGGPELLHQLASHLLKRNVDAKMYYIPHDIANPQDTTFKEYHVPYATQIINAPENILIVPEAQSNIAYNPGFQKIRKILWWLSVDNWLRNILRTYAQFYNYGNFLSIPFPKKFSFNAQNSKLVHWVQSEYARQFLLLNHVNEENIHFVSDYLSPAFLHPYLPKKYTHNRPEVLYINGFNNFHAMCINNLYT